MATTWTKEELQRLKKLYEMGKAVSKIAEELGKPRSTVAYRLRKDFGYQPASKPKKPKTSESELQTPVKQRPRQSLTERIAAPTVAACQWPFGDPRLPGFHFCGASAKPNKPYCDKHCARAYNRVSAAEADERANREAEALAAQLARALEP